jgi:Cu/Ag efflux pump CusA
MVIQGACESFAPTIMSYVTFAFALLPFIAFGQRAGTEIINPMALVVLGGLVTSTFYSLFVTPALYFRLGMSQEADLEIFPKAPTGDAQLPATPASAD